MKEWLEWSFDELLASLEGFPFIRLAIITVALAFIFGYEIALCFLAGCVIGWILG